MQLLRPDHAAGVEVECHHPVTRRRHRGGIVVTRGHVEPASFQIEGRRGPDSNAGWTPRLDTIGCLPSTFRRPSDRVRLPDDASITDAQSGDAAAKRAARVFRVEGTRFLPRGGADVRYAVDDERRRAQANRFMIFRALAPDFFPRRGIERVEPAGEVT